MSFPISNKAAFSGEIVPLTCGQKFCRVVALISLVALAILTAGLPLAFEGFRNLIKQFYFDLKSGRRITAMGIANHGQSCFMNAAVQLLRSNKPAVAALRAKTDKTALQQQFLAAIDAFSSPLSGRKKNVDDQAYRLYQTLFSGAPNLAVTEKGKQQDASELLLKLELEEKDPMEITSDNIEQIILNASAHTDRPPFLTVPLGRYVESEGKVSLHYEPLALKRVDEKNISLTEGKGRLVLADTEYRVTGFIIHEGYSLNSGHYTCCAQMQGSWVLFNDNSPVQILSDGEADRLFSRCSVLMLERAPAAL